MKKRYVSKTTRADRCESVARSEGRVTGLNSLAALDLRRIAATLTAFVAAVLVSGPAFADSGNVRYSYEKVEIGSETNWTLVPYSEEELKGEVSRTTVRKAFSLLKSDKEKSYGNTSMSLEGDSPGEMMATIDIPSAQKELSLVIISEVVYTLSGLGVSTIKFPGYTDGAVTRADVPLSAYTLTIPLFRALPERPLVDARVRLPDGTVLPAEEAYRRWNNGDQQLVSAMYAYLDSQERYTVQWVLQKLPKLDIPYVEQVVPLLSHEEPAVRKTALETLANKRNEKTVLNAVAKRLDNESNDDLTRNVAEFLGKSDDRQFQVLEQFYLLEKGDDEEALSAAKKLGDWDGDSRVVDHLEAELTDDRKKLAMQAAESLISLDAHDVLAASLEADDIVGEVKMRVARSLSEDSEPSARLPGLVYLGNHLTGREARQSLRAMEDLQVDGTRTALENFLTDETQRLRKTAAEVLRDRGSLESLSAIASAVEQFDQSEELEQTGYELLVEKPTSTILRYTDASNSVVQRMAFRALGTRAAREGGGSSDVFETLRTGASSSDSLIRGAAARGLGAIGNDRALDVLEGMTDDPEATVRRDVALALGNYEEGTLKSTLKSYLEDDDPRVVAAAISSFEKRKTSDVWDEVQARVDADDPEVKAAALSAVATLCPRDSDDKVSRVISQLSGALSSSQTDHVVLTAIEALGKFSNENAVRSIAIQLNANDNQFRAAAVRALAATGQPSASDLIVDVLNDKSSEVRLAAVRALRKLKAVSAVSALKNRLDKEDNKEIRGEIESTLKQL